MSLSSLHAIELHLILHHCDSHSWLALARCSRATLAAASAEFARKHLTLVIDFQHPWPVDKNKKKGIFASLKRAFTRPAESVSLAQLLSGSSLLRAVPVALRWSAAPRLTPDLLVPVDEVAALLAVSHLTALTAPDREGPAYEWARVSQSPSLAALTSLRLPASSLLLTRDLISQLTRHAPGLRSLCIDATCRAVSDASVRQGTEEVTMAEALATLPRLTCLTELRWLADGPDGSEKSAAMPQQQQPQSQPMRSLARALPACASLLSLELQCISAASLFDILRSESLRSLEHLSLSGVAAQSPADPRDFRIRFDWGACFSNLPRLRSLTLRRCNAVGLLTQGLLAAVQGGGSGGSQSGLHSLVVIPLDRPDSPYYGHAATQWPSVHEVEGVLQALPSLTSYELHVQAERAQLPADSELSIYELNKALGPSGTGSHNGARAFIGLSTFDDVTPVVIGPYPEAVAGLGLQRLEQRQPNPKRFRLVCVDELPGGVCSVCGELRRSHHAVQRECFEGRTAEM